MVNLIACPWLTATTILRFFSRFRQTLRSGLFNPRLVFFFFFTIVADTDVFGVDSRKA
jgi:hypothetical protein